MLLLVSGDMLGCNSGCFVVSLGRVVCGGLLVSLLPGFV